MPYLHIRPVLVHRETGVGQNPGGILGPPVLGKRGWSAVFIPEGRQLRVIALAPVRRTKIKNIKSFIVGTKNPRNNGDNRWKQWFKQMICLEWEREGGREIQNQLLKTVVAWTRRKRERGTVESKPPAVGFFGKPK